ncbi:hypothetical protein Gogos_021057 [Gossypium gossypioides]|uniref:DUF642 domain-containing protein n=1 Tax=Gossypium gossypioides TaxID=34282 RepID=A0A7J9CY37_GOSGO|nr:hypothetical protein [Gossypium gossypioides]
MQGLVLLSVLLCASCHISLSLTNSTASKGTVADGLLENGNFENAPNATNMKGTVVVGRYAIPGWVNEGFVEYIKSGQKQGDMLLVVPQGAYAVRLGNEASIKQKIKVIKGMYYSITFSAARTCAQEERLNVTVAPDSGILPIQTVYSSSGWDNYAWAFKAIYEVAELIIHNPGVEEDPACGPLIDAVAIKALYPPRPTNSKCFNSQSAYVSILLKFLFL